MAAWDREPGTQGAPWDTALSFRFRMCLFPGTVKSSLNTLRCPSSEFGGTKASKGIWNCTRGIGVERWTGKPSATVSNSDAVN